MQIRNGFDSLFWSGLKTGAENYIFWCEIRSGFGRHTPRKNSWQYPPPPPRGYTVNSISADTFRKWIPKDGPCFSSVCSSHYPLGVPSLRRIVLTVEGNSNINKTIAFTYLERIEGKLFPDMKVMIVFVSHNTCLTSSEVAVMCCPRH